MRCLLSILLLSAWGSLRALPTSFGDILFGATASTAGSEKPWRLSDGLPTSGLRIDMLPDGTTKTVSDCPPHPDRLATATMTRLLEPVGDDGRERFRLTYTVTAAADFPKVRLSVTLLASDRFPPCSVRPWGDRLALVADAGDWYIITDRPEAAFTVSAAEPPRITLTIPRTDLSFHRPAVFSLTVGDGPLPPVPEDD